MLHCLIARDLGVAGGAAAAGAIVGGTSGAIAGAFAKAGYDEHEANYYGSAVEQGGVVVAVDTQGDADKANKAEALMAHFGGRFAGTA